MLASNNLISDSTAGMYINKIIFSIVLVIFPGIVQAATGGGEQTNLTNHFVGYFAIALFILALFMFVIEEQIHLRKSKPVLLAAGLIWASIAIMYIDHDDQHMVEQAAVITCLSMPN